MIINVLFGSLFTAFAILEFCRMEKTNQIILFIDVVAAGLNWHAAIMRYYGV